MSDRQERRHFDRRISPAIGQHAIQECARLRAVNAELLAALKQCKAFDDEGELPTNTLRLQVESAIAKAESK